MESKIECFGCGTQITLSYKKPALFQPTVTKYNCKTCGANVIVKVIKSSNKNAGFLPMSFNGITKLKELKKQIKVKPKNPYDKQVV